MIQVTPIQECQLDEIGGYAYLTQVSSRIPTTAQSNYFIEKVRELTKTRLLHIRYVKRSQNLAGIALAKLHPR